jgi:formate dehydrogenase major subunit
MVSLTINGHQIKTSPDKTILQICKEQNLDSIPTLCYDEKLPPFGSCFLCVVEVEGQSRLFPACATKVNEGMNIFTRSEKVVRARKTCLELLLSDHYADCFGPCRLNCPADVDIQGYMSLIALGKFKEAVSLIKEKNPLPSVCGRVCTRKCEINCRRTMLDGAVGIDFLKRYAADQDMIGKMWQPDVKPDNGVEVAIIGSGPAGLTAAYYLVLEGYRPTVFESLPHPGGMLRYGIPEYRLPKDVLDKEINWILDLGVELKLNQTLGKDFTIDDLFKRGFRAVFVGLGAQVGKPMQVENENVEGVLSGVEFLKQVQMGTNPKIGGRVVVVGGGNTALDAARTSLRLGASEVIILYRRTKTEMPANAMEIKAAEDEGIRLEILAAPTRVNVENERVATLTCIRMELGEPDSSGRRRPVEIKGSDYTLPCAWVISAIGQEPDLDGVDDDTKIRVTKWKTIEAKKGTFDTNRPGVFAGGDVVTGPADAIDAIAAGRMAARAIDKYIQTNKVEKFVDRFESRRDNFHKLAPQDLPQLEQVDRSHAPEKSVMERISSFVEVEDAYDDTTANIEALRCAECGCDVGLACLLQDYCTEYGVDQTRFVGEFNRYKVDTRHPFIKLDANKCIRCGRCVSVCSEILNVSALGFVNRGFRTIVKPALEKALHETNCVSCGNCIDVCPTGAIVEKMPFRRSGPWKMDSHFSVCNYCSVGCNVTLKVKTPDIYFVTGAPADLGPNQGELCIKGRFGYQQFLDGTRATKPMVRKGGRLVEVSWDEAFAAVADGIARIRAAHSPDTFFISASPKLTDEEMYFIGRFARAGLRTNNLTSFQRLSTGADYNALDSVLGFTGATVAPDDIAAADLYLFLGGNPTVENPILGWQMKRRMRQGTKAVVINSGQIDLTQYATVWADARRGTATLLLTGIIGEIVRTGNVNRDFVHKHAVGADQVIKMAEKTDLLEIASVTGVDPEKIHEIAALVSHPNAKVVAWYNQESRIDRAPDDLKALTALLLLVGKLGVPGNGLALMTNQSNAAGARLAGCDSHLLPGGVSPDHASVFREVAAVWKTDLLPLFIKSGTSLTRKLHDSELRAAFVFGENPAVAPEYNALFNNLEFLVVADLYLTDTARMANVFLPLSHYLEGSGHLTNWSGHRQMTHPIGAPANGMASYDLFCRLNELAGHTISAKNFAELGAELDYLIDQARKSQNGHLFPTTDGKAHLSLWATRAGATSALAPQVLEIDARMAIRMKNIRA